MRKIDRLAEIKTLLAKIKSTEQIGTVIPQETVDSLLGAFSSLEKTLREYIQEITQDKIIAIIDKLKIKEVLTREELGYVELWIVGDAEYYTRLKINFGQRLREVRRNLEDVKGYDGTKLDLEASNMLRAVLKDGVRNLSDLDYFIREEERVGHFKKSIQQLDDDARDMLIEILEGKLESEEF